jgi:TPP-dependent pyruvate/acetoin dehydrogenase alpha subunit
MQITPTAASPPPFAGLGSGPAPTPSAAEQQFNDWAKQTPAQQMRAEVLRELGYNQDDLDKMSAEDRAKVEEKIKELTKEKVQEASEKKTGVVIDIKA